MIITTDDLCLSNLGNFRYFDKIKKKKPYLKVIAFTIANYMNKEDLSKSSEFKAWYEEHKEWVEVGVHGYDHCQDKLQEGWREDQEYYIRKSLDILRPFLPEKYLYRAPGFRVLNKTETILKELGFTGIAHQEFIKYFSGEKHAVFNTHCTFNKFNNAIGMIWKKL